MTGGGASLGLPWISGDPEVLEVLLARRASHRRPGQHDDGHRVVLVVEGGGMRGAYIGGMVRSLHALGLRDTLDEIIAVSAGAFSAAGLTADNVDHVVKVYADDLARGGFVSWRRFLGRQGPLIQLDFLIEEVLDRRIGFDYRPLINSDLPLLPVATDLDTLESVPLRGMLDADDWRAALRASSTVPLLAGPPVTWRGHRYVDGFVADALPLARAVASGATHVLALVARAPGERLRTGRRGHALTGRRLDALAPGLGALMAERATSYADSLEIITDRNHRHRGDASVLAVRPTHSCRVSALTTDPDRLWAAGAAGEAAVRRAVEAVTSRPAGPAAFTGRPARAGRRT